MRIGKMLSAFLSGVLILGVLSMSAFADSSVAINETNFPDENFRNFISNRFDSDKNGSLSEKEISSTESILLYNMSVSNLKGIEFFTSLQKLECNSNQLSSLDVSKNTALKVLNCDGNQLKDLDVSKNTSLITLSCRNNQITSLDISKNTELENFYCSNNKIVKIDLSNNPKLKTLFCYSCDLKSLDLSNHACLTEVSCYSNSSLTDLDLSNDTALEKLKCYSCKISNLNVSGCTSLKEINCRHNVLSSLDISNNSQLSELNCSHNQLTSLDINKNTALVTLNCNNNLLTDLNVSMCNDLTELTCENNQLTELNLGKKTKLIKLECYENQLTNLDITYCDNCLYAYINADIESSLGKSFCKIEKDGVEILFSFDYKVNIITDKLTPTPTPANNPVGNPELNVDDFVARCYRVALQREPEQEGYDYWVSSLNNGAACGAQVGYGFIFSGEYFNRNRSNDEYVSDLYAMYFDREPDSEGYKYWVDMLEAGTAREVVFAGFANSIEFYNLCLKYNVTCGYYIVNMDLEQQGGINCFIARLYKVCLNRLPDQGGQNGWVLKLINGEVGGSTAAYGFIFSPEFIGMNLDNTTFVKYMYKAFFGREADEEGLNYWVNCLETGIASREDVFAGFSGSAEFADLCIRYGITV